MSHPNVNQSIHGAIDYQRLARKNLCLSGQVEQSELPDLKTVVSAQQAVVDYQLHFGYKNGLYIIEGKLETELSLLCLNCLHEVHCPVTCIMKLVVVEDEAKLAVVPESYEAWVLTEKKLTLESLLTEELLLAVPMDAKHQEGECELEPGL